MRIVLKHLLRIIATLFGLVEIYTQLLVAVLMWDDKFVSDEIMLTKIWTNEDD